MRELSLREMQSGALEILKWFIACCENHDWDYFLTYGTLLGAVRHQGFIPWDDDIDVMMPREDYEQFIAFCNRNKEKNMPFELMHYSCNKKYIYPIARISDSRYSVIYSNAPDYGLGLFIDVYPIDACGNNIEEVKKYINETKALRSMVVLSGLEKFVPSKTSLLKTPIKFCAFLYSKLRGCNYFLRKVDTKAKKRVMGDAYYSCVIWEFSTNNMWTKEDFDGYEYTDFEGIKVRIPKTFDSVLQRNYGNYMELPPMDERVPHHEYVAYRKNEDGKYVY